MRNVAIAIVLPLVLLTGLPAQAQMVIMSPQQIGQIFCISSLGNDMSPAQTQFTPDLITTIANALAISDAVALQHPDEKPPLGDGVPWRTWQDYADGCAVGAIEADEWVARVTIDYSFSEEPAANYSNELILYNQDDFWALDDVDLGDGNTLRSVLAAAVEPWASGRLSY